MDLNHVCELIYIACIKFTVYVVNFRYVRSFLHLRLEYTNPTALINRSSLCILSIITSTYFNIILNFILMQFKIFVQRRICGTVVP